jgi:hypothetical protein
MRYPRLPMPSELIPDPTLPRWIRIGPAVFDLDTGDRVAEGAAATRLTPAELDTLRKLVAAGNAGVSALRLGREAPGAAARSPEKREATGQQRASRLRDALGAEGAAHLATLPGGIYRLAFTVEEGRGRLSEAADRLRARIEARLPPAGWRVGEGSLAFGDRAVATDVLLGASVWLEAAPGLRFLPPLLGADRPVPLATVYVDLRLSSTMGTYDPALLGRTRSLADALADRRRRRESRSHSLAEVLGPGQAARIVLLGDPGSGKSSLLRRAARDVATGALPRWAIPVLIDLPTWWSVRARVGPTCDLETYGAATLLAQTCGPGALDAARWVGGVGPAQLLAQALSPLSDGGRDTVLFLCDALDELAGDPEAIAAAQHAIRALGRRHAFVVSSRPSGFPNGLDEDVRYSLCDLDTDGIEGLIDAWFRHQAEGGRADAEDKARGLAIQIRANPRLLDMGRNPFLLTLLCHLVEADHPLLPEPAPVGRPVSAAPGSPAASEKAAARRHRRGPAPGPTLPVLRASIYEAILSLAHVQARQRVPDCFDAPARARLGTLCAALQLGEGGPRHFFGADEWAHLFPTAPSFDRSILPARIVSQWSESGRYHLVHLTFHEYLVARNLVDDGRVQDIVDRVFRPGWSMIVRFAAGILAARGRMDDVATLVRALVEPGELLGRADIDAAAILVEAGVCDSTALLGYDMRERLWAVFGAGRPLLEEAAAEALGILDTSWAYARCKAIFDASATLPDADSSETSLAIVHNHNHKTQRALYLLASVPDPRAEEDLVRRVLDPTGNAVEGTIAASLLAQRDRRHVRARLVRAAANASRVVLGRFATYASRAPHPALVDPAIACLARVNDPTATLELIDALLSAGVPRGWDAALVWVAADLSGRAEDFAGLLAGCLRVSATGDLRARGVTWFRETTKDRSLGAALRDAVYTEMVRAGEGGAELVARLRRGGDLQPLLEAVRESGESGIVYDTELDTFLDALGTPAARTAIHAVEMGRWLSEHPTFRKAPITTDIRATNRDVRTSAWMAAGTIEASELLPAMLDRAETKLHGEEAMALVGAIGLLAPTRLTRPGPSIDPDLHARTIARLEAWLDARPTGDLRQQAADALVFWDFGVAGTRLGDRDVRTALARACAETGRLAFEKGWIDPLGNWHPWGKA